MSRCAHTSMRELLEQQEIDGGDEMFAEVENDIEFEGNDGASAPRSRR